ncbi:hypothetical protein AURDEDRAFT_130665 [Auricularia subglabra TFB-10046 SS5]|uniref:C2H2-type domain-containing protein n=1 Tax=Auricularia subglabra (strain TFB-10046 / SS5) TaxID=717982 RepID=J0WRK1_AURST|nr:hypothetical protein AURDEDRAFT_130665 [Auricularia subglabra TFB-10046 SS5]
MPPSPPHKLYDDFTRSWKGTHSAVRSKSPEELLRFSSAEPIAPDVHGHSSPLSPGGTHTAPPSSNVPLEDPESEPAYPFVLVNDPNVPLRRGGILLAPFLGLVPDGGEQASQVPAGTSSTSHTTSQRPRASGTSVRDGSIKKARPGRPGRRSGQVEARPLTTEGPQLQWEPYEFRPSPSSSPSSSRRPRAPKRDRDPGVLAFVHEPYSANTPLSASFPCTHCNCWFPSASEQTYHVETYHKALELPSTYPPAYESLPHAWPQYEGRRFVQFDATGARVVEYQCGHCDQTFPDRLLLKKHVKATHGG